MTILYHPGKANVVADALSRKASNMESLAAIHVKEQYFARDVHGLANGLVRLQLLDKGGVLTFLEARSLLMD